MGEYPASPAFWGISQRSHINITPVRLAMLTDIEPSRDKDEIYRILSFGIDLNNIKFKLILKVDINAHLKHLQIYKRRCFTDCSFIEQISVKCLLQVDPRLGTGEIRTNHTWFLCKRITTHEQILCFIANYTWGAGATNYMGKYYSHGKHSRGDNWAMHKEKSLPVQEWQKENDVRKYTGI